MRVLVCGGRMFGRVPPDCPPEDQAREKARAAAEQALLRSTLDQMHAARRFAVLIEGEALGADKLSRWWAERRGLPVLQFPVTPLDYQRWGNGAFPIRNQRMLDEGRPGLVIAFRGGRGTADMVARARRAGVEVVEVK